jgi:Yip1 domain
MSTPSQPTPSAALPQEPAQPGLSEPARIIDTFIAPSKTFQDIKRKPSWFAPWVVNAVFLLIFAVVGVQKLDLVQLVRQGIEHSAMAQRRLEQATPEQRERGLQMQATISKVSFFLSPVFVLIAGLVIAGVLLAVFNFGFGAEIPFNRALAVTFYSMLPGVISTLLVIISVLLSSDPNSIDFASGNPIATSPAFFMDWNGNKFLYALVSSVDVIRIWEILLLGLGFAIVSTTGRRKLAPSTAIVTILVIYCVLAIGRAALAAVF